MRCKSASTLTRDAYRAGAQIGQAMQDLAPEVLFLFASPAYQDDFEGLCDGICEALERRPIIFGGTSDGIYELARVARNGVCALGLNSGGSVQWKTGIEPGVAADSYGAAQRCAARSLKELGGEPDFVFVFADGVKADGSQIVAGISSVISAPFAGGLAGDDRKFERSWVLVDGKAYEDVVAVLLGKGNIPYLLNSASGWAPVGDSGQIEQCQGNRVERISGVTAQDFIQQQIGKSPGQTELGIVPLATYDPGGHYFLRTPSRLDPATGTATMFGSVEKNATVRVCAATLENVLQGVDEAMRGAQQSGFTPSGALVISCAGRRWLLEDRSSEEVQRVLAALGKAVPLAGLPSFGEIGPFRKQDGTYTATFFHNVTFVICLFGA